MNFALVVSNILWNEHKAVSLGRKKRGGSRGATLSFIVFELTVLTSTQGELLVIVQLTESRLCKLLK